MAVDIIISMLCAAAVIMLIWLLRGVLLTPVAFGANTCCVITLSVHGAEPGLENAIEGLTWLRRNGTLRAEIVIEDAGMDAETRHVALISARERSFITLVETGEI